MDKIIKIINEVSIKAVELICMESAQKLSLWITKNKKQHQLNYDYNDGLLLETIYLLPEDYHVWLEQKNFIKIIKIKKELRLNELYYNSRSGELIWFDRDTGLSYTIAAITEKGLIIYDNLPMHAPFSLDNFEEDGCRINVNYD